MENDIVLRKAMRQVEALKGFYIHAIIFVCVTILLVAINYMTGPPWWAQWPFLGWGAGVLGHAVAVFSPVSILGADWEKRKVRQLVERERAKQQTTA